MRKILIADGAEGFREELRLVLSSKFQVVCADDGTRAWELLEQHQPDLLILDLELPEIDGITLLHRMKSAGQHTAVLVLARLVSDYTVDALTQLQVGYLLRKPCRVNNAAQRAEDILRYYVPETKPAYVSELMESLGVPQNLRGCKYLLTAISLMSDNPAQYITKELYPAIGKQFGVDGKRVERCIRNAIDKAWEAGSDDAWLRCFGTDKCGLGSKPSNSAFIMGVLESLNSKSREMGKP